MSFTTHLPVIYHLKKFSFITTFSTDSFFSIFGFTSNLNHVFYLNTRWAQGLKSLRRSQSWLH